MKNLKNVLKKKGIKAMFIILLLPIIVGGGYLISRPIQGVRISEHHRTDTLYLQISRLSKFDDYINGSDWKIPSLEWEFGCTSFFAPADKGSYYFGRNFDWRDSIPMVVKMIKSPGYDSISVVDASFFGIYSNRLIKLLPASILQQTVRMPMDGMNEKGLVVSGMYVGSMEMIDREDVPNLFSVEITRLALNYAATVNETIELWKQYDTVFPPGPPQHYLVADASGDAAVIEWYDGEMQVVRNYPTYAVATNHRLFLHENETAQACSRYDSVNTTLAANPEGISEELAFEILETTAQDITQWSCVYDIADKSVSIVFKGDFEEEVVSYRL